MAEIQIKNVTSSVAEIVSAYVENNSIPSSELPQLIASVHASLSRLDGLPPNLDPAVPVKQSVKPNYVLCLEDGKKLKMLKRHLRTVFSMTPDEYRAKWSLPKDYPMVAPNYAKVRSKLAKKIGLGNKLRA